MQVQAGLVGGVREYVLLEIVVAELRAKGKNEVGVLSQVDAPRLRRSSPSSIVSPRAVLSFSLPALNADETSTRRHERGSPDTLNGPSECFEVRRSLVGNSGATKTMHPFDLSVRV